MPLPTAVCAMWPTVSASSNACCRSIRTKWWPLALAPRTISPERVSRNGEAERRAPCAHQLRKLGALLPMGGSQAHKAYGLSVIVEVLCGLLTGLGFGVAADARHNDGNFDVARFRDPQEFAADVAAFIDYLKDTPPAPGFNEVLVPGEIETRTAAVRRTEGIHVDETTWQQLISLGG